MYQSEDKPERELYTIKVLDSIIVRYEYIYGHIHLKKLVK